MCERCKQIDTKVEDGRIVRVFGRPGQAADDGSLAAAPSHRHFFAITSLDTYDRATFLRSRRSFSRIDIITEDFLHGRI